MNASLLYSALAAGVRKARGPRRFPRERQSRHLYEQMQSYWRSGIDKLVYHLGLHDGWERIQRHVQQRLAAESFTKALSDQDRQFLLNLLSHFGYYDNVEAKAHLIMQATQFDTFEAAATFALKQIGVQSPEFELTNPAIRDRLLERSGAAIFSTRSHIDSTFDTIIEHFVDLGQNPYNDRFVANLKRDLLYETDWQAKRFALTETGIAAELAQHETYKRNGVGGKQWNATGVNTREDHAVLAGMQVDIDGTFDVGGNPADHPLDPRLPADELCNCHCWLSPVVADDFTIDPARIWEGK